MNVERRKEMLAPIKKNVILELIEKEKTTASGIVLTKADPNEANRGKVIAIGPEVEDVKVGDEVLPNWNQGRKLKYDDKEIWVVSEDHIVLVFED